MGMLEYGAGAAKGLEQYLAEELAKEKMGEEVRSNKAGEELQGRQLNESSALRRENAAATNAERMRQDEDRNQNRIRQTVSMRPVGSNVTPDERTAETAAGVPSALYKNNLPQVDSRSMAAGVTAPSRGNSGAQVTASVHAGNDAKPGNIEWVGTEAQREAQQRIDNVGADSVERVETPGPGGRKTINFVPKKGIAGKSFEGYVTPQQPVVIQSNEGPQLVDRGKGTAKPITEAGSGEVVQAQDPAMVRQQKQNAGKVRSHITNIKTEAEQVNALGLMGPIGGRFNEFATGKWGSVKDLSAALGRPLTTQEATLANKFRADVGLLQSGMAMVHGGQRGGGSIAMNAKMEGLINSKRMDLPSFLGAVQSFDEWLQTYQSDPAKAIAGDFQGGQAGGSGSNIKSIKEITPGAR